MLDKITINNFRETEIDIEVYDSGYGQDVSYTISRKNFDKIIDKYYRKTDSKRNNNDRYKVILINI
jgi:hypothetical protein